MKPTQDHIDQAYAEGKQTYLRDVGTHGPTLNPPPLVKTPNPYSKGKAARHGSRQRSANA
jgi:hypothetical protein